MKPFHLESYLPNLPMDEQKHRLVKIAIQCVTEREDSGLPGPYLINTYLGKFILRKDSDWTAEWVHPKKQLTMRQGPNGVWGEGLLPNAPTR